MEQNGNVLKDAIKGILDNGKISNVKVITIGEDGNIVDFCDKQNEVETAPDNNFGPDEIFRETDLICKDSMFARSGSPELVDVLKKASAEYTKGYGMIPEVIDSMDPEYHLLPSGEEGATLTPNNLFARSVYQARLGTVNMVSAATCIEGGATPEESLAVLTDINADFNKMARTIFGDMMGCINSTICGLMIDTFLCDEAIAAHAKDIENYIQNARRFNLNGETRFVINRENILDNYDLGGVFRGPVVTSWSQFFDRISELSAYRVHSTPMYNNPTGSDEAIYVNGRLIPLHVSMVMNAVAMDVNRAATMAYLKYKDLYGEEHARICYNHVMSTFMEVHLPEIRRFVFSTIHEVATIALAHLNALDAAKVKEPKEINYAGNCPWRINFGYYGDDY